MIVRGIPRERAYNPFARGGTVLCQFDPGAGDTSPFSRVCVLPEGFEAYVAEAARAAGANRPSARRPKPLSGG